MVTLRNALTLAIIWAPFSWLASRLWFICDDAYISFRYAQNLSQGLGLRFNPGEGPPIEGFSNLLWVLIATIPEAIAADAPTWMPILSFSCGLALLWAFHRAVRDHWTASPAVALLTTLLLSTSVSFCMWATGGLATMPQALITFLFFERLFLARGAPAWRSATLLGVLLVLIRTEGIGWVLLMVSLVPLVWGHTERAWRPALQRIVAIVVAVTVVLLVWRLHTYGSLVANTAAIKVSFGPERVTRGLRYVMSFGLITLTPALCVLGAPWAIRAHGRLGWATLAMAIAFPAYSAVVGGDFMPMGRFLVPGLAFGAMLAGSAIDAAWTQLPQHRRQVGAAAVGLAILGALPGIEPETGTPDESLPDDAGIHLVPQSLRESLRFKYLMKDHRFTSDLKTWETMVTRAKYWARTGKALGLVLAPGDSLIKGGIGAVGYYSRLHIYDTYGLVSPEVQAHRGRADAMPSKGPGHDVFVKSSFFLKYKPTVFRHKLIQGNNLYGKVRFSLEAWQVSGKTQKRYAPRIYRIPDPGDEPTVLLLLKRIGPATKPKKAWRRYYRQLRDLYIAQEAATGGDMSSPPSPSTDPR